MNQIEQAIDNRHFTTKSFLNIYTNKGYLGAVAEKAILNFNTKQKDTIERLHYFAVRHSFKQLNPKIWIDNVNSIADEEPLKRFHSISLGAFYGIFEENQKGFSHLISNIRNQCSHFLHTINEVNIVNISSSILAFIRESFELALIQAYITKEIDKELEKRHIKGDFEPLSLIEKEKFLDTINANNADNPTFVNFVKSLFFQSLYDNSELKPRQVEEKNYIDTQCKTKADLIDFLLFRKVDEDFYWKLNPNGNESEGNHTHNMLLIPKGTYLSFEAFLFVLSMFLYKNEANQLIPRISGFKKNQKPEDNAKLNVFRFFAKKFKSQDVDSEERSSVYFRDLILYLNKYPVEWKKAIESNLTISDQLKNEVFILEIKRAYPVYKDNNRFLEFCKIELFQKLLALSERVKKLKEQFSTEYEEFMYELYTNPIIKDLDAKNSSLQAQIKKKSLIQKKLNYTLEKNNEKINKLIQTKKDKINPKTAKLLLRINHNLLYNSYCRNQDRFMEYALRFLAENNYFGEKAQFKMYRFYDTYEQNLYLDSVTEKKKKDKIKYHRSRITTYKTYSEHLSTYNNWDFPFVIQNNAILIKLEGVSKPICIQRQLIRYFLEDALYNMSANGENLLKDYLIQLENDFEKAIADFHSDTFDKAKLSKLLPLKLLNTKAEPIHNHNYNQLNAFQKILNDAENQEKRYQKLRSQAILDNSLQLFDQKNKGKSFKLRFIRKAWNLMYFKESYLKNVESQQNKHHKRFHITRDEFNNFSKWMYAMELKANKTNLKHLLGQKGFLENKEFNQIIENLTTLNNCYANTKKKFGEWMIKQSPILSNNPNWDNYKCLYKKGPTQLNAVHFKEYLKDKNLLQIKDGKIQYPSLQNAGFLINEYYYKDRFDIEKKDRKEYKENIKIYNALKINRHEDCLLYQMALNYMAHEIINVPKAAVTEILQQDFAFKITDKVKIEEDGKTVGRKLNYSVIVPFRQIEQFRQIYQFNKEQDRNYSVLFRLPEYIKLLKSTDFVNKNDLSELLDNFTNRNEIKQQHLVTINNHLITNQAKFTVCILALEEYYIWKNKLTIRNENRLSISEITTLNEMLDTKDRNPAFHFNLPFNTTYSDVLMKLEKEFIIKENLKMYTAYKEIPTMAKSVLNVFLKVLHSHFFTNTNRNDRKKKFEDAEIKYMEFIETNA